MIRLVYLHGFASSPQSGKAQFFRRRFAERGLDLQIPMLDRGDFRNLSITGQLEVVDQAVAGEPSILFGSSLGGYLAALYAARHSNVQRLVLLAPAFRFPSRWRMRHTPEELAAWERNGFALVYHYGFQKEVPIGYQLMEDSRKYEDEPELQQSALILHGRRDTVVPVSISVEYAETHSNVELRELDSDHELSDVMEQLWAETARFLSLGGSSSNPSATLSLV